MKNLITLLDVNIPIIQAPMAGVQDSQLAVAVSNAGALGSLPAAMLSLDTLHKELTYLKQQTSKPVNLNFFCHPMPEPNVQQQALWLQELQPYFNEYNIDTAQIKLDSSRYPFNKQHLEILAEFKPKVISFHFGLPEPALVDQLKAWGTTILSTATTVEEAIFLQNHGADIIIAQGLEAGGHRGMFLTNDLTSQMGTMALIPQLVEAVQLPVIAAGGMADARCIKAALALGASGVQVGTSYLLCPEAKASLLHKQALLSNLSKHTALTNVFTGRPARSIINKAIQQLGPFNSFAPTFPYASSAINAIRVKAEFFGNSDFTPLWAGQNTSGCSLIPAAELTKQLAKGI